MKKQSNPPPTYPKPEPSPAPPAPNGTDPRFLHIAEIVADEVGKYLVHFETDNKIRRSVRERLNKDRDVIIGKMLGFAPSHFGETWEIDHCNGRTSTMTELLGPQIEVAAVQWVKEAGKEFLADQPADQFKDAIKKEFYASVVRRCKELIYKRAEQAAEAIVSKLTTEQLEKLVIFK